MNQKEFEEKWHWQKIKSTGYYPFLDKDKIYVVTAALFEYQEDKGTIFAIAEYTDELFESKKKDLNIFSEALVKAESKVRFTIMLEEIEILEERFELIQ